MSIGPTSAQAARQGLQTAVLGQDSARHRRFRSVASDCNLGFPGAALHWYSKIPAMEPDEAIWEMSAKWARIWSGSSQSGSSSFVRKMAAAQNGVDDDTAEPDGAS